MSFKRCLVLFALVLAGAGLAEAQEQTFVCVDAINGDSADAAHTGWIDAFGLDHTTLGQGSAGDVSILKGTDRASTKLHSRAVSGTLISSVTIEVCRPGGAGNECYYRVILENVRVSQVGVAGSSCVDTSTSCTPAQTESVSFSFDRITWFYDTIGSGTNEECWDLVGNTSCTVPTTYCGS